MCHGSWIIWGYPYYFGWPGILFHLAILALIVWAVVTVVKSLISQKAERH